MRATALTLLSLAATPAAGDFSLVQPIDCTLDDTCYIQQFVDHDPGPGVTDFACGSLSYEGHKGTDFALPSLLALAAGVNVLAAADGIVRGLRNDMADVLQGTPGAPDVSDKECGNGVVLTHNHGYETQYCHMKQGSITVRSGDMIRAGDVLGQVGLSGQTEFPHLHLSVRRDAAVIDPFDPDGVITCNQPSDETLWADPLPTPPGGLISVGLSDAVPTFDAIKSGPPSVQSLRTNGPALVVWGHMFGSHLGDVVEITITGPLGPVITHTETLERAQAQLFRAAGRRTPSGGWPPGAYNAAVKMLRDGTILDQQVLTFAVTP